MTETIDSLEILQIKLVAKKNRISTIRGISISELAVIISIYSIALTVVQETTVKFLLVGICFVLALFMFLSNLYFLYSNYIIELKIGAVKLALKKKQKRHNRKI